MAPHAITNGDIHPKRRNVTILVTGFGPFQERYPINPSHEITRSLPATFSTKAVGGANVHIIPYGTPIRVCYKEVRELIPVLHESFFGTIDLVLHIGMASGRDFYTLELYGHRDGYTKNKDLDGKTLPPEDGTTHFGDCPAMMTTSLDFDAVLRRWRESLANVPSTSPASDADVRPSEDAGHYLCDYIYFNSLAWYGRQSGRLDGGKAFDRPVMFLHVPAHSDSKAIEKGRQVTMALIGSMVENWLASRETGRI